MADGASRTPPDDHDRREIRYLGDLQRLALQPGDKFVLRVPDPLSVQTQERLLAAWLEFVGPDVPLLILSPGMQLGAIGLAPPATR